MWRVLDISTNQISHTWLWCQQIGGFAIIKQPLSHTMLTHTPPCHCFLLAIVISHLNLHTPTQHWQNIQHDTPKYTYFSIVIRFASKTFEQHFYIRKCVSRMYLWIPCYWHRVHIIDWIIKCGSEKGAKQASDHLC